MSNFKLTLKRFKPFLRSPTIPIKCEATRKGTPYPFSSHTMLVNFILFVTLERNKEKKIGRRTLSPQLVKVSCKGSEPGEEAEDLSTRTINPIRAAAEGSCTGKVFLGPGAQPMIALRPPWGQLPRDAKQRQ
ncbi:hypothetical protein CDAR_236361 [Caerostris darwini]|uniref:Uncharacterized protein n=1 Tax=Caerostris darwini TaxID=1538125 RepID=A0AAV4TBI8_9ARAC|nr:hypothetical protein CDAR_236361 [Caerostris darwini]